MNDFFTQEDLYELGANPDCLDSEDEENEKRENDVFSLLKKVQPIACVFAHALYPGITYQVTYTFPGHQKKFTRLFKYLPDYNRWIPPDRAYDWFEAEDISDELKIALDQFPSQPVNEEAVEFLTSTYKETIQEMFSNPENRKDSDVTKLMSQLDLTSGIEIRCLGLILPEIHFVVVTTENTVQGKTFFIETGVAAASRDASKIVCVFPILPYKECMSKPYTFQGIDLCFIGFRHALMNDSNFGSTIEMELFTRQFFSTQCLTNLQICDQIMCVCRPLHIPEEKNAYIVLHLLVSGFKPGLKMPLLLFMKYSECSMERCVFQNKLKLEWSINNNGASVSMTLKATVLTDKEGYANTYDEITFPYSDYEFKMYNFKKRMYFYNDPTPKLSVMLDPASQTKRPITIEASIIYVDVTMLFKSIYEKKSFLDNQK